MSPVVQSTTSSNCAKLRPLHNSQSLKQSNNSHIHGYNVNHTSDDIRLIESRGGRSTSYIPSPEVAELARNSRRTKTKISSIGKKTTVEIQAQLSKFESSGTTSGWLPTVRGQSGVSRIASKPQATATASTSAVLSSNSTSVDSTEISSVMSRTHKSSSRALGSKTSKQNTEVINTLNVNTTGLKSTNKLKIQGMAHQLPSIRFSTHQDPRGQRPSLVFTPMLRVLTSGNEVIKVGRYSEKDNQLAQAAYTLSSAPIGFKSKVVSRRHCEFWYYAGNWFMKDVKSSSGTFLNHIRLSAPGTESIPFPVHDGDIVQLGIDFKGGEEMIFRCVKIKLELNKGWQTGPSSFNMQSHKRLCELNTMGKVVSNHPSQDCSICLCPIGPCQPLFVAPCSHTWHYKCIRVIINGPFWPQFICPNCRSITDLEAEVDEVPDEEWEENRFEKKMIDDGSIAGPSTNPIIPRNNLSTANSSGNFESAQLEGSNVNGEIPNTLKENSCETSQDTVDQRLNEVDFELNSIQLNESYVSLNFSNLERNESTRVPQNIIPQASFEINQPKSISLHNSQNISPESTNSVRAVSGVEISLTPTNSFGPYVFDGNVSNLQTSNVSSINLTASDKLSDLCVSSKAK